MLSLHTVRSKAFTHPHITHIHTHVLGRSTRLSSVLECTQRDSKCLVCLSFTYTLIGILINPPIPTHLLWLWFVFLLSLCAFLLELKLKVSATISAIIVHCFLQLSYSFSFVGSKPTQYCELIVSSLSKSWVACVRSAFAGRFTNVDSPPSNWLGWLCIIYVNKIAFSLQLIVKGIWQQAVRHCLFAV